MSKIQGVNSSLGMENVNENSKSLFLDKNIRYLRKQKSWSQEELATKIGLNRGNIASYEKGTAEPKICNLLKLAHVFGVTILDITGKDLRLDSTTLLMNENGNNSIAAMKIELLDKYIEKVEELETVVNSIYNCHCFKLKQIDELPKDYQAIVTHFEQMHEVTHSLLDSHKELLESIRRKAISKNNQEIGYLKERKA